MHYDSRNRENIAKLADNTKVLTLKWYEYCVKNNINILIYETIRTEEQQRQNVANGKSQTMKSYHLVGQALDFVPVNNKGQTLWNGYEAADIKKAVAYAKSLGFEWGGDWKSFVDKPHLQYNYKGYGTDTFGKLNVKEVAEVSNYEMSTPEKRVIDLLSKYGYASKDYKMPNRDVSNILSVIYLLVKDLEDKGLLK